MLKLSQTVNAVILTMACMASSCTQAGTPPLPVLNDGTLLKLIQSIPVDGTEGRFDHFGFDAKNNRLYAAALGNDSLEVIDLTAGKRIQSLKGLKGPTGVRVLPETGQVIVASGGDGRVRIYSPDFKLAGEIKDLDDADNVRLEPDGKRVYVGYGDGAIAIIDPLKTAKIGNIKLDGHPEAFQLETRGNRIFVNVPSAKQVAVIDRESQALLARWPMREAEANFPMALDEAGHRLFIGCRSPATVLILDTTTGAMVASVPCCGDTDDLFYDPAVKRLYVSGGEGFVSVIQQDDTNHYRTVGNLPTASGARTSQFLSASGRLFVAVPHRKNQPAELRVYERPKQN